MIDFANILIIKNLQVVLKIFSKTLAEMKFWLYLCTAIERSCNNKKMVW